jgi:hypothetical protein
MAMDAPAGHHEATTGRAGRGVGKKHGNPPVESEGVYSVIVKGQTNYN